MGGIEHLKLAVERFAQLRRYASGVGQHGGVPERLDVFVCKLHAHSIVTWRRNILLSRGSIVKRHDVTGASPLSHRRQAHAADQEIVAQGRLGETPPELERDQGDFGAISESTPSAIRMCQGPDPCHILDMQSGKYDIVI